MAIKKVTIARYYSDACCCCRRGACRSTAPVSSFVSIL